MDNYICSENFKFVFLGTSYILATRYRLISFEIYINDLPNHCDKTWNFNYNLVYTFSIKKKNDI